MRLNDVLKAAGMAVCLAMTVGSFQQSQAALLEVSSGGIIGNIEGENLKNGQSENGLIVGFDEQQDVQTSSEIKVDYLISESSIGETFSGINHPQKDSPLLGTGTYDSHLFHFDPVGKNGGKADPVSFTFDGDIVAIIANTQYLKGTDSVFGAADEYATGTDRRSENHETFTILAANTIRLDNFKVGKRYIDNLRVITTPPAEDVPEPTAAFALSALGLLGAVKKFLTA